MKLIDRYIIRELTGPFLFGIAAFTFILAGSTILYNLIGSAVRMNIPMGHVVQLFLFKIPIVLALSFPMSTLLATILAVGRLGSDLEILAFRASGISILRIVVPIIAFGFAVSVLTYWFNEAVVPVSTKNAENLFSSYRDTEQPTIKENINFTEYENKLPARIINVGEVDKGKLKNITVAEYETGQLVRLIRADNGRWLKSGGWEFYDGIMHNFLIDDPKRATIIQFKKEFIDIKINPLDFDKRNKKTEELTRKELLRNIDLFKRTGRDPIEFTMHYHLRLAISFSSLIYALLGASVGLRPHRSSSAMGLGMSLIIIFIYIILFSIGMGLGMSHTLPPLLAAWFPNIIVGSAGILLLRRLSGQ